MSTPRRFKFTHRLIDGLPPNESDAPSREAEYSDTEISGLKCLVGKGEGKRSFSCAISGGAANAISIGHWPEIDVTVARKIATEMKRQIASGTDPRYERDKCRAIPTLQEAFSQYYFPWAKLHKRAGTRMSSAFVTI